MAVFNVLVAGVGGQGVLLAAGILAESALMSGLDVKLSEVRGMAQRGGSVLCHVRFGEKVYSPVIGAGQCDLLIGFEPVETARYLHYLKDGAVAVYNTRRIATLTTSTGAEIYPEDIDRIISSSRAKVYPLDATAIASEAGDSRALNLALLGAAAPFLPLEQGLIISALKRSVPKGTLDANTKAFLSGLSRVNPSYSR